MQDQNFYMGEIKKVEVLLRQLKTDLSTLFENGRIPAEEDKVKQLLEFQKHLREAQHPLGKMFESAIDTRIALEKELGV